jgi:hypothetical protein
MIQWLQNSHSHFFSLPQSDASFICKVRADTHTFCTCSISSGDQTDKERYLEYIFLSDNKYATFKQRHVGYVFKFIWWCHYLSNLVGIGKAGHTVAQLVEALCYKPEDPRFDSQWCHWNFSLT